MFQKLSEKVLPENVASGLSSHAEWQDQTQVYALTTSCWTTQRSESQAPRNNGSHSIV